ncbi:ABC transporter ATP-binding protein [Neorhizobium galegae]|uniref:ABC transporter ATP-binding protein n=1 Tax=Neorhizobium galegae TaxID=399 RepID=UPI0006214D30|nr:sn-glycerol-3-phosphate ABC transporter ATP-binding protein UgpC [Neorhizobium galegae]CDZ29626.1 ATPase component of ABC-type sugar transporter [Neorhizobium galegae bv. officinalis]KAA9388648.1 sn-glycerol-3-phosphate ABC transporter ATP-binding protein UgpC [Neorhizobium galegae]KAB1113959.1 sn-glycerol-3-phosphate ABC transporter ATP-binding protein UgpC [Neorhizobium galegae]MCM2501059.1 sn-glycerol-3-phosphate ABC transporter ATP-binding protein UgpC [Neorhizobium galegae]MCQ1770952.1
MATVTLQNIQKRFGAVKVIQDLSVDIADGEFVVLVGPSGCGKSTLLRMVAGLEEVSGGEIRIGAREVSNLPARDRDIAMVFQNYALYPHMTVEDNMGFALKLKRANPADTAERVKKAAAILGLEKLLDRYPRQLSGGQRQRVAMGRAIVRNPQVFLFDEPLSNLDAKLRVVMRGEIKAMHQRIGTTTIYVTHDQIEAMTMADKIVVLHDGNIEQVGAPLELYDRPANLFVAGFIGSPAMNFLDGKIEEGVFRTDKGLILPLPAEVSPAKAGGRPLVYGIRPEHIRASDQGIQGRATIVEGTGSEIFAKLDCGGEQLSCLFRERIDVRFGDTVGISVDAKQVHLFDKATGHRL